MGHMHNAVQEQSALGQGPLNMTMEKILTGAAALLTAASVGGLFLASR